MFHRPSGRYCSCHAAQAINGREGELSENILQDLWDDLTPQTVPDSHAIIIISPVAAEVDVVALPRDGVDLLGEDGVQHAPQQDVEVAEQEEEHGHLVRGFYHKC